MSSRSSSSSGGLSGPGRSEGWSSKPLRRSSRSSSLEFKSSKLSVCLRIVDAPDLEVPVLVLMAT